MPQTKGQKRKRLRSGTIPVSTTSVWRKSSGLEDLRICTIKKKKKTKKKKRCIAGGAKTTVGTSYFPTRRIPGQVESIISPLPWPPEDRPRSDVAGGDAVGEGFHERASFLP